MSNLTPFNHVSDRVRELIVKSSGETRLGDTEFNALALELFRLQSESIGPLRSLCLARGIEPEVVRDWRDIPAMPTTAFKDLDLTCLPVAQRTAVFLSSGTTDQRPSRHFHWAESLALYEASLLAWFDQCVMSELFDRRKRVVSEESPSPRPSPPVGERVPEGWVRGIPGNSKSMAVEPVLTIFSLTPPVEAVPHSSLAHMFDCVARRHAPDAHGFFGRVNSDGGWDLDFVSLMAGLAEAQSASNPVLLLGTAFSFVHLLDRMKSERIGIQLPPGSRVLETGGYKGRSRALPKFELHKRIRIRLGVPEDRIVCEYGMSELSSQAYDKGQRPETEGRDSKSRESRMISLNRESPSPHPSPPMGERVPEGRPRGIPGSGVAENNSATDERPFHFPPWARSVIVSPETGEEVEEGAVGLIRVYDLANVYSVMAVQTGDLAVKNSDGFELIGRFAGAEPRGCSLMTI